MQVKRPKIEQAIIAVCKHEGFNIRRIPKEHAGGKWQLNFQSALGQNSNLEAPCDTIELDKYKLYD